MLKDRKEAEDRPLLHALKIKFAEIPNILAACLWEIPSILFIFLSSGSLWSLGRLFTWGISKVPRIVFMALHRGRLIFF